MSVDVTRALERRRMRGRLTLWRVLAVVFGIVALAVAGLSASGGQSALFGGKHIARVEITGLIQSNRAQLELLETLKNDSDVAAIVLAVNSPGGTTAGGEALFLKIREVAEKKPVVAVFDTIATSAAYIVGLASDRIVARGNTITGSVGVIFQWAEVGVLLDKIGVRMNEIKSGPLKAEPSMFSPLSEEARRLTEEMVSESQAWFNGLVSERRSVDIAGVPGLTDGRIYSGRQALAHRLVDELGGESEAIRWLVAEKGIEDDLEVRDRKPKSLEDLSFLSRATAAALELAGLEGAARALRGDIAARIEAFQLEGLVSIWHANRN